MKNDELVETMQGDGYEMGGLNEIDIQVCRESTCDECGHKGMKLSPWKKGGSYRAFAVCDECDEAIEF